MIGFSPEYIFQAMALFTICRNSTRQCLTVAGDSPFLERPYFQPFEIECRDLVQAFSIEGRGEVLLVAELVIASPSGFVCLGPFEIFERYILEVRDILFLFWKLLTMTNASQSFRPYLKSQFRLRAFACKTFSQAFLEPVL